MRKSLLTTKISLGSPPNMPYFVQSSFETLSKHPTHAVTFDIHIYKSTAQRHQTRIYSEWSASTIHWHTLYSQSPQMWQGNWPGQAAQLSVAQLSLPLSKFYMRSWQSKRPQFEYILENITQVSSTFLNFLYKDNAWTCNRFIWSVHEHISHLSSALQHCQVHSVLAHISHIIRNSSSWGIVIIGHVVEHSPSVLQAPVCGIHVNEPTTH
jgi:hypothetical protein